MTDKSLATAEVTEAEALRKPPVIDPAQVRHLEEIGRTMVIRLPKDCILGDLSSPDLWGKVQRSPATSLRKLDKVVLIAWDESWLVESWVASANDRSVTLTTPRKVDLVARTEIMDGDDEHEVAWIGDGFRVRRRADGLLVSPTLPTAAAARRFLDNNVYARPV